jgi:SAM-dependent methyltransferase
MTTNPVPAIPSPELTPVYTPASRRGTFLASFTDGQSMEVEPGRARLYPGLRGEAPSMSAFYDAFADFVGTGRVLDAGSGAGMGSARLAARGLNVLAVDLDPVAVSFARRQAPSAEHQMKDLVALDLDSALDGAIVADVLSHALEPEAALLAVGRGLRLGAPLLVAEPAAHVSQRLSVPQRRAFSVGRLRSLLLRTGFEVDAVICDRVPFVALLATARDRGVAEAFATAYARAAEGDLGGALAALDTARASGRNPVEVEVLLAETELFLAAGDGDRAATACFLARKMAPNDARPLVGLGRIALSSAGPSDALHLALDALRHDITEPTAYALAAIAADALGHPDAFTAWRTATNLAPDDMVVVGELARSASARGDHALALASLERLEGYGAELEAEHHVTRAWLLLAAGRRGDAATEARIAAAKHANPVDLQALEQAIAKV